MAPLSAWKWLYNLRCKHFIVSTRCHVKSRHSNSVFSGQKPTEEFSSEHIKTTGLPQHSPFPCVFHVLFSLLLKWFNSASLKDLKPEQDFTLCFAVITRFFFPLWVIKLATFTAHFRAGTGLFWDHPHRRGQSFIGQ